LWALKEEELLAPEHSGKGLAHHPGLLPDAIYFTPFTNTASVGPIVIEIPLADEGSITGTVMDLWHCALEDVGPAGVDKGQ
jgi:hypothetical protein